MSDYDCKSGKKCIQCNREYKMNDIFQFDSHYCKDCAIKRYIKGDMLLVMYKGYLVPVVVNDISPVMITDICKNYIIHGIGVQNKKCYNITLFDVMGKIIPTALWKD